MKTRTVVALCIIIVAVGGYVVYEQLMSSATPYIPVSELVKSEEYYQQPVQVIGVIEKGSVAWKGGNLTFMLTDGESSVRVLYLGGTPSGFQEGNEVVVVGKLTSNLQIQADQLLVKCPSKYES